MPLDLSATATALLTKLASNTHVKIKRVTGASTDNVSGIDTGGVETITAVPAAVTGLNAALIADTRIQANDTRVVCDNSYPPLMSDTIIIGTSNYKIVAINEKNHAGIIQAIEVICRG